MICCGSQAAPLILLQILYSLLFIFLQEHESLKDDFQELIGKLQLKTTLV